jgi:hypothetical protein
MMNENPYDILAVSPLASDREITKAFAGAMKSRKYPPDAIAKARKSLMNPQERMIADYLRPCLPMIERYRQPQLAPIEEGEIELSFLPEFDRLDALIAETQTNEPTSAARELGSILFPDV